MATNQQIVDRAAYELGYIEYGASLDAVDAADALTAFNSMMHQWKQRSMDFNWFTQDTLGDTAPVPKWAESSVISNLAMKLATVFTVSPSQQLYDDARIGRRTIGNTLINEALESADMRHLPQGSGRYNNRYDIGSDS